MIEPLPNFYEKVSKQADRLKKGLNVVDEEVFHETFSLVQKIFNDKGMLLPNHKIKFLLQSPDVNTLQKRVPKLGKRFLSQ